jgi:hypothetical protein
MNRKPFPGFALRLKTFFPPPRLHFLRDFHPFSLDFYALWPKPRAPAGIAKGSAILTVPAPSCYNQGGSFNFPAIEKTGFLARKPDFLRSEGNGTDNFQRS